MAEHHFTPETFYNTIGSHEPALYIKDGDTVMTSTLDAHGGDRDGTKKAPRSNPMTGPIYVEGVEPGDALMVTFEIRSFRIAIGAGAADVFIPNLVDPILPPSCRREVEGFWQIDAEKGTAWINAQPSIGQATLPLSPFVGCFGVAPPGGQAISPISSDFRTAWREHGLQRLCRWCHRLFSGICRRSAVASRRWARSAR